MHYVNLLFAQFIYHAIYYRITIHYYHIFSHNISPYMGIFLSPAICSKNLLKKGYPPLRIPLIPYVPFCRLT